MRNQARLGLLILGDMLSLFLAFCVMILVGSSSLFDFDFFELHWFPFLVLTIFWLLIFFVFDLYDTHSTKPTIPYLKKIFWAFGSAFVFAMIFFYTFSFFEISPKTNLAIFTLVSIIVFIFWRRIFYNIFASGFRTDILFLLKNKESQECANVLARYIEKYPQSGLKISGVYGSIENMPKNFNYKNIILVIAKEIWQNPENFSKINKGANEIWDLAQIYEEILGMVPIEIIDEGWFMHNIRSKKKILNNFFARFWGSFLATIILFLFSPIILIIILAIKTEDGGKIFYTQDRVGKNGKKFKLYKFRSMIENAEQNGAVWSSKEDSRVTKVGKIIRKTHLDELPQMLNIIKGDMSLVGPRPERPEFVEKLEREIPFYGLRHVIAPGFTGWAQIKFRYAGNVLDSKEKFKYDLYYLKNGNIFMDLGILARTVQIIFKH